MITFSPHLSAVTKTFLRNTPMRGHSSSSSSILITGSQQVVLCFLFDASSQIPLIRYFPSCPIHKISVGLTIFIFTIVHKIPMSLFSLPSLTQDDDNIFFPILSTTTHSLPNALTRRLSLTNEGLFIIVIDTAMTTVPFLCHQTELSNPAFGWHAVKKKRKRNGVTYYGSQK